MRLAPSIRLSGVHRSVPKKAMEAMASSSSLLAREGDRVVHTCLHFTGKEKKVDMASLSSPPEGKG